MTDHSPASLTTLQKAPAEQVLPRFLSLVPSHAKTLSPTLKPLGELALRQAEASLQSATTADFGRELTASLTLVAPSGMTQADRNEWLKTAWDSLIGIPADLLASACFTARRTCDHPSKIVPTIMREVEAEWRRRRSMRSEVLAALGKMKVDEPLAPEDRCTPEQAAEIIAKLGNLKIQPDKPVRAFNTPPEKPDRAWYIAHGIDPDATYEPTDERKSA